MVTIFPGKNKLGSKTNGIATAIFIVINFLVVTCCWVFFRASSISEAGKYLAHIFSFQQGVSKFGLNAVELLFSAGFIAAMLFRENKFKSHYIKSDVSFAFYLTFMIVCCYFFGVFGENQFIYFQF